MRQAEYIWLDGENPTQQVRSKSRIVAVDESDSFVAAAYPEWGFDGSSTYQATGHDSDLILRPVRVVRDPIRGGDARLILCEVFSPNGQPHATNTRARLRAALDNGGAELDPWVGFEQEYTLFRGDRPYGFPADGSAQKAQGPFYCGVGSDRIFGREFVEAHTQACIDAGLMLYGTNAEVMPGQWEFQIGYRGLDGESPDVLHVSDQLVLARWLLRRVGEDHGVEPRLDPKPVQGDWNGAGNHTNFSTASMRNAATGMAAIRDAVERLALRHAEHIRGYGHGNENRLTGQHETCAIDEFRSGVADRGASIRIPRSVQIEGKGYLEDRRPGANCDPYTVCALLLETICAPSSTAAVA
ncbi:MAG: glutamine synthetase beta-grasp domain-containing protein [Planctomycetes bacterium]|nr:glutamine synthetase beta-grasp domain-containing protein [Planctomycetota bacterium]